MKKIFMMIALVLCALGTAFAEKYYNSESEFYMDLDKAARKYKWCCVVDVFDEGENEGFFSEFVDDEYEVWEGFCYEAEKEGVCIFFAHDWTIIDKTIKAAFESWALHWFEMPKDYYKALTLTKALVEVCK